jgi:hypothetical protein
MKRESPCVQVSLASAFALLLYLAKPGVADAVSCPVGGAKVKVCVRNDTGSTTPQIILTGTYIQNEITCTGPSPPIVAEYGAYLVVPSNQTACVPDDLPVNGLVSGMYVHKISVASTGQEQYQQKPVLFSSDPMMRTRIDWTYFPNVVKVTKTTDSSCTGSCTTSCGTNCTTNCTLREAINKANSIPGGILSPVLIQFLTSGTFQMSNVQCSPPAMMITRDSLTIDGTDSNGNPWIVGDRNAHEAGSQDAFPRVVDLKGNTNLEILADKVTIKGLHIKNTISETSAQNKNLIFVRNGSIDVTVRSVKIEGGNTLNCSGSGAPAACNNARDLINVGEPSPTPASVTVSNVDGHSSIDKAVKAASEGSVTVEDSWFHHNYRGGIQATQNGTADVMRSTLELNGRRITDNVVMDDGANGLAANGGSSEITSDSNIVWLNRNNGTAVNSGTAVMATTGNDYLCGNRFSGMGIAQSGVKPVFAMSGSAAVYNNGRGIQIGNTNGFAGNTVRPSNAFAHNNTHDFENNSGSTVDATNNQWGTSTPRWTGSSTVNWSPVQNHVSVDLTLDLNQAIYPTNVILNGQTTRISGQGFNAIGGNPPVPTPGPTPGCTRGDVPSGPSGSCCLIKPSAANGCAGVHDPVLGGGNCVEIQNPNAPGGWEPLTVSAVTPTRIVTKIPDYSVFPCKGSDSALWVSKRTGPGMGDKEEDSKPYCTNDYPAEF